MSQELDAEVAVKIMGLPGVGYYKRRSCRTGEWEPCAKDSFTEDEPSWKAGLYHRYFEGDDIRAVPPYSTQWDSAKWVVQTMETLHYQWEFARTNPVMSMHENRPYARFWTYKEGVLQPMGSATCDTLPEAICRAALSALAAQEEPKDGKN